MTTNIQTYDVNELTLSTTDPTVTELQLTISSSLMTNYEPSRSVDSQHSIDVAEDVNGNPMVFSVGTVNELYVICHTTDPTAPWTQIDLTSSLGVGWQVEHFCLLQAPQGSIYLALAIKDSNKQSHFYITAALPNDPSNAVWTGDFTSQWVERPFSEKFTSIDHILMSGGAAATDPPTIVATASQSNGQSDRYYVNGNTSEQKDLWQPWPIPQNATHVIDVAVGTMPILGAGSFILYQVGTALQLDFTTASKLNVSRSLTPPDGAMALATLQNTDGTTDLYVAGNGVYVFTSSNMGKNAVAAKIGATINAGTGTEMVVRQDSANIAVWVLDQGVLYYLHGTKGATIKWTTPLPVQQNVGQIAALRNTVLDTNELFLVTADEQLAYLYQDPLTTLWKEMLMPLPDAGSALPIQCYTTQITLRDQNNNPVTKGFTIGASEWTYLTVNGSAYIVDENVREPITPDPTGSITIITKVATPATPTLFLAGDFFSTIVDINPQGVINNNLVQFTTASALTSATDQNGQKVISGPTKIPVEKAASALDQLTALHGTTASASGVSTRTAGQSPGNLVNVAALPKTFGFTVAGVDAGAATLDSSTAALAAHGMRASTMIAPHQALITNDAGDDLIAFFGDVMETIENALQKVGDFFIQVAHEVATFTIKLANDTVSFILDTASKVMRVIGWVLDQITVGFDELINWLGFIFNWDDIVTAHNIIVNVANKGFELAETKLGEAENTVADFFDNLKNQLGGLTPMTDPNASLSVLSQSQNPAPGFSSSQKQQANYLKSPGGNFANYHLQHSGILTATPPKTSPASGNAIVDVFTQVIEPIGKDIGKTVEDVFVDLRDGFVSGTLTPNQAITQVKTDAISGVLDIAEDAAEGALKVADDLVTSIQGQINNQWNIPFLTPLYSQVTGGSPLTLLDAMALLIAIPGVPMYKLGTGTSPFVNGTYGLDNSSTDATTFFAMLSGQSTQPAPALAHVGASTMPAMAIPGVAVTTAPEPEPTTPPAAILYSQIGGCFYIAAEVLSMTLDAVQTEADGETPKACYYIALAAETVMQAGSYPVGDGAAVKVLRIVWGVYLVALLRFVALIIGGAKAEKGVGVFEITFAIIKGIVFLAVIEIQTIGDSGTELALEWETFFGNLIDAIARGFSGAAKIDPDKELSGLALDVIAVWLSVIGILFDGVRMSIVLGDDQYNEFHAF